MKYPTCDKVMVAKRLIYIKVIRKPWLKRHWDTSYEYRQHHKNIFINQ